MPKSVGRPMKYKHFLLVLEDEKIYCPATIVLNGEKHGLFSSDLEPEQLRKQKVRIRHTFARFSANHGFPRQGDGLSSDFVDGQAPQRGWLGSRWKQRFSEKGQS